MQVDTAVKRMFIGVISHRSSPFGLVAFPLSVKTVSWVEGSMSIKEYQTQHREKLLLCNNFRERRALSDRVPYNL